MAIISANTFGHFLTWVLSHPYATASVTSGLIGGGIGAAMAPSGQRLEGVAKGAFIGAGIGVGITRLNRAVVRRQVAGNPELQQRLIGSIEQLSSKFNEPWIGRMQEALRSYYGLR